MSEIKVMTNDEIISFCIKKDYEIFKRDEEIKRLHSIIKEVGEYITSYESIETIQQCEHSENNKGLDRGTMREMTNRYLKVHDNILEILEKEKE